MAEVVTGTTGTGDSSGAGQLGRLGKDVKADGCRQAIGAWSTAAAGKGERPTTRDGPESTELGPRTVSTAYKRSSGACARPWPSADLCWHLVERSGERQWTGAGVARLGVETTRPAVSRLKSKLIPSYDERHGPWRPKELGRPSARSRASADAHPDRVYRSLGGKGLTTYQF